MQLAAVKPISESQLFWLLRILYSATDRLPDSIPDKEEAKAILGRAWIAASANEAALLEKAVADLDSWAHLNRPHTISRKEISRLQVVRALTRCAQEEWPYHFEVH